MIVARDGAVAAALAAAHGQPFRGAETREAFVAAEAVQDALVSHFVLNLRKSATTLTNTNARSHILRICIGIRNVQVALLIKNIVMCFDILLHTPLRIKKKIIIKIPCIYNIL